MQSTEPRLRPTVVSAAAGRMRVQAMGFQHDSALAASIEEMVATVTGVRAVRAYPRTASVVIWYAPRECDTEAVLSAIARAQKVAGGSHASRAGSARVQNGVVNKILGGLTHTLLNPQRGATEAPPEIQRLRAALDRLGYDVALPGGPRRLDNEVKRCGLRPRRRWTWVALPLGLVAVKVTGLGLHSMKLWAAGMSARPGGSRRLRFRRPASALVVLATSAPAVPTWGGVVVSLLLVTVAGTIAYRRRLGLTREIVVAAARAAVQLVAAGALLRVLFQQTRLLGAAGWVTGMVVIAGQVAGRRAPQLPQARVAATSGVATSTVFTLGTLLAGRVIAAETRVDCSGWRHDCLVGHAGGGKRVGAARPRSSSLAASHRGPPVPRPIRATSDPALPTLRPAHRVDSRHRFDEGRWADQPARRHDRTDPGRHQSAHRDPLSDRGDVHAARRHRAGRPRSDPRRRRVALRRRATPDSNKPVRRTLTGTGNVGRVHRR